MSPKKMIGLSFAAAAAKLYEVFGQAEAPHPRMRGVLAYLNKKFLLQCAAGRK
jgi:hypothetical protein